MSSYMLSQLIAQLVAGLLGDAVNGFKKRSLRDWFRLNWPSTTVWEELSKFRGYVTKTKIVV